MQHHQSTPGDAPSTPSISRWVFFAFIGVAAFFLMTEHRAHLFGVLPFLLLIACPLLHVLHHRGHSRGHHRDHERKQMAPPEDRTPLR